MFIVWTVYSSLPAAPPTALITLPLTSYGHVMHGFVWPLYLSQEAQCYVISEADKNKLV
jgi:hypothetical protein